LKENPDFLSKNPKHIIEVFGDYWHRRKDMMARDKKRFTTYASLGYKTLVIWEHELKEPQKVADKIGRFIENEGWKKIIQDKE
jgi:G:T-mismatch repair DNA endonuclease (very short patch repair protein)